MKRIPALKKKKALVATQQKSPFVHLRAILYARPALPAQDFKAISRGTKFYVRNQLNANTPFISSTLKG